MIDVQIFLCEAPGIWGKMIDGFDHLWESNAEIYLTENVGAVGSNFAVNTNTAKKIEFTHEKRDELCMKVCDIHTIFYFYHL